MTTSPDDFSYLIEGGRLRRWLRMLDQGGDGIDAVRDELDSLVSPPLRG